MSDSTPRYNTGNIGPRCPNCTDGCDARRFCEDCDTIICVRCWAEHNEDAECHVPIASVTTTPVSEVLTNYFAEELAKGIAEKNELDAQFSTEDLLALGVSEEEIEEIRTEMRASSVAVEHHDENSIIFYTGVQPTLIEVREDPPDETALVKQEVFVLVHCSDDDDDTILDVYSTVDAARRAYRGLTFVEKQRGREWLAERYVDDRYHGYLLTRFEVQR